MNTDPAHLWGRPVTAPVEDVSFHCSGCGRPMTYASYIGGHFDENTLRPLSFLFCRACGQVLQDVFGLGAIVPKLEEFLTAVFGEWWW